MSWEAFLPANVAQHPSNFLGPNIAGTVIQALETGIILNQFVRFWSRAGDERRVIQIMVIFLIATALFQTAIAFYNTWRVVVFNFGDWITVVNLQWPDRIQPTLNALMSAPVQIFFIWRCWTALHRRLVILIGLGMLLSASIIMFIVITVDVFNYKTSNINPERLIHLAFPPRNYITAFVLSAVLDIAITILMLCILIRAKSQVVTRRFDKILGQLLIMLWEAALPPAACAIATCVVYITMSLDNLWDIFLQSILGKLYVISLFVTLNGRADLKNLPLSINTQGDQSPGLTRYWVPGVEGRVHLTTIVDRVDSPDSSLLGQSDVELTPTTVSSGRRPFADSQQLALGHAHTRDKEAKANEKSMILPELHKIMDSGIDLELGFDSGAQFGSTATPNPRPVKLQMQERVDAASPGTVTRPEARPP